MGDYVLTCGEIPALTFMNGVIRLLPGTVAKVDSIRQDSFQDGLLDFPHYTRPPVFRDWPVPDVLRSGNHQAIAAWRREQQISRTQQRRPDLYRRWLASDEDQEP
ncbi:MAG: tRNA (guanosine(37)-N1)-methyltransferase TrmD, partial [Cyanobacteria bacterium P01_F01_bin.42]